VVTFNIRYDNGRGTSDANAWNRTDNPRRERVVSLVRDMAPDLMGVQEALDNQVEDLTSALSDYGFVGVGRDDGDQAGEYAGIFYRTDRLEPIDSGHFWLSETPDVPGTVFEGSGSIRMATWLIARDLSAERELFMLNTHWDNVSQSSREASASLIRQRAPELAAGRPLLLTGDLNQSEDNAALQILLQAPNDASPQLLDGYRTVYPQRQANEVTFHDFTGTTQGSRIDFVLHTPEFEAIGAEIRTDRFDGTYPSDHYPVRVTLEWLPQ